MKSLLNILTIASENATLTTTVKKGQEHFDELLYVWGLDKELLKVNGTYQIPDEDAAFIISFINQYSKLIEMRKGNFESVSVDKRLEVISNFYNILVKLGKSKEEAYWARRRMELWTNTVISSELQNLNVEIKEVIALKDRIVADVLVNDSDRAYFIRHIASILHSTVEELGELYGFYKDTRQEELYELAVEESESGGTDLSERAAKELFLAEALFKLPEYSKLADIVFHSNEEYLRKRKDKIEAAHSRMCEIRKQTEIELFGEVMPDEELEMLNLRTSESILNEAIEYQKTSKEELAAFNDEMARCFRRGDEQ